MKSKVFVLECSSLGKLSSNEQFFEVSLLPAYAISTAMVSVNGLITYVDDDSLRIDGQRLIWNSSKCGYALEASDLVRLEIRYDGIRDFSLLFPDIVSSDPQRAIRLGQFYNESETCFDGGAWLCFMLMSGAIFEHILYAKVSSPANTLSALTAQALSQGIIDKSEEKIITMTRSYRNAIHCNKIMSPYVQRKDAMDAKSLIERLILTI